MPRDLPDTLPLMSAGDAAQRMAQTYAAHVFRGYQRRNDPRQTVRDAAKICRLALVQIEPDKALRRLYTAIDDMLLIAGGTYDDATQREYALSEASAAVIRAAEDWAGKQ